MIAEKIKIPSDFMSLHELKELVKHHESLALGNKSLREYQGEYVKSFLMTRDEVMDYIPASKLEKYKVKFKGKEIGRYWKRTDGAFPSGYEYPPVYETMLKYSLKRGKVFIVNSKDKIIEIAGWTYDKPKKLRVGNKYFDFPAVDYISALIFEVDSKNNKLILKVPFSFTGYQEVGGVSIWTGGGGSYRSGGTNVPYQRLGEYIYEFCTKTNKFLGYIRTKEDIPRGWIKKTSRY